MAIAINTSSKNKNSSSGTTLSWSHTSSSGSNRYIVVGVCARAQADTSNPTVTYGGEALSVLQDNTAQSGMYIWLLGRKAQLTGENTVEITLGSSADFIIGFAVDLTGVDQTTPTSGPNYGYGSGLTPSCTITSAASSLVIDTAFHKSDTLSQALTAGSGQTSLQQDSSENSSTLRIGKAGMSWEDGASSVVMDWTSPNSNIWAAVGVSINPATGGPTPPYINVTISG